MQSSFPPRLVKDLPPPPALERLVGDACRRFGLRTEQDKAWVAEELKLQFNYGGMDVACVETTQGRTVIAAGTPDEVGRDLERLPAEQRCRVTLLCPAPWEEVTVPTGFTREA